MVRNETGRSIRTLKGVSVLAVLLTAACLGGGPPPEAGETRAHQEASDSVHIHGPGGTAAPAGASYGAVPRFVQRTVAEGLAYEPTVGVSGKGTAFYPTYSYVGPGVPISLSQVAIQRSRDAGVHWEDVTPTMAGRYAWHITFDPIMHVDPITDRAFFAYTYGGCMGVAWTDDEGRTWDENQAVCVWTMNDHQTLFTGPAAGSTSTGYPNVVYLCSNQSFAYRQQMATCLTSRDGGQTWTPPSMPLLAPFDEADEPACGPTYPYLQGHGAASWADGTAYLPFVFCDKTFVGVSRDEGDTWQAVLVDDTTEPPYHEARVATDSDGNVYVAWIGLDGHPYMAISRDEGASWSIPIDMAFAELETATHRYVAATAGAPGRAAFAYVGTEQPIDGSESWNVYVVTTLNALDDDVVFFTTTAHEPDDPINKGTCGLGTQTCGTQPNGMSDYFGMDRDPTTGAVWVAYADMCTEACVPEDGGHDDSEPWNRASVGVQTGGPTLLDGSPLKTLTGQD